MRPLTILIAALLLGALNPASAWAAEKPLEDYSYQVIYSGPFRPLVKAGSDFFSHMGAFRAGQTQTGVFLCENNSSAPAAFSVRLVPKGDVLGDMVTTEFCEEGENGASLGVLSPNGDDEVRLGTLQAGERRAYRFAVTPSEELSLARSTQAVGKVEWEFTARQAKSELGTSTASDGEKPPPGIAESAGGESDTEAPESKHPAVTDQRNENAERTLPKTGDAPVAAAWIAGALACAALALYARIRKGTL